MTRGALAAFEALDRVGVRWCLWRGTPRLEASFAGRSDIDLLVERGDLEALHRAVAEAGFKRAQTAPQRTAPGLEDWLGLGGPTGPMQHLHVHERMLVGEPRLYRFRLPWEQDVLERRRRVEGSPVWIADATDEAALLLIRSALQIRWRDRLPGHPATGRLIDKIEHDLERLLETASPAEVVERTRGWISEAPRRLFGRLPNVTAADLAELGSASRRSLAKHTFQGSGAAALSGLRRELAAGGRRLARSGLGPLPRATRVGPRGSRAIAVVADDPGRAAEVADALFKLFAGKLDAIRVPDTGSAARRLSRAAAARDLGWLALLSAPAAAAAELSGSDGAGTRVDAALCVAAAGRESSGFFGLPADQVDRIPPGSDPGESLIWAVARAWDQV